MLTLARRGRTAVISVMYVIPTFVRCRYTTTAHTQCVAAAICLCFILRSNKSNFMMIVIINTCAYVRRHTRTRTREINVRACVRACVRTYVCQARNEPKKSRRPPSSLHMATCVYICCLHVYVCPSVFPSSKLSLFQDRIACVAGC